MRIGTALVLIAIGAILRFAVDVSTDGRELVITNTNDSGAGSDPCGGLSPKDGTAECAYGEPATHNVASMIKGSVQLVKLPLAAATLAAQPLLGERELRVALGELAEATLVAPLGGP